MGPGAPGIDPAMFGMGGGPPEAMGPGASTPGPQNPMADPALQALGQLNPAGPNPTAAMQKMNEALDLAYRLVSTVISQAQMSNPRVAKDGHAVARSILNMKSELSEAMEPGIPPDMMLGMGSAGAPSPMGPSAPSPGGGPVGTA